MEREVCQGYGASSETLAGTGALELAIDSVEVASEDMSELRTALTAGP